VGRLAAPENFLLLRSWHKQDLAGVHFCAERHVEPRSALVEYGFDKKLVEDLPKFNMENSTTTNRLPREMSHNLIAFDKSQDMIEWYECYVKMDDGDGASELRRICVSGGASKVILEDEPAELVCYAMGVAIINPHTFIGISMYDKLKSTQDTSTALTRGLMDNLNAVTKNRTAHFDGIVETDDLEDGRVNGSIRVKPGIVQDVRAAVTGFTVPDASANILQNLEHTRRMRSEMGGASLDMATGQMQLNDRVGSQGLDRAYSVMEKLAAFMTRMLAHTLVRSMYLITHETLRTQWQGSISFKRGKNWITQEPSKWQVRDAVHVNLGMSPGERQRLAAVLEKLMTLQASLAQQGMEDVLVDVQSYYNAAMDWMRMCDLAMPERYMLNPLSDQGKAALQRNAVQKQQSAAKQDALMKQAIALEQLRTAFDKYKTDAELQFKYYDAVLTAQVEEARLTSSAVVNIMSARDAANKAQRENANDSGGTAKNPSETDAGQSASSGSV
jgi:hypothetical protein